MAHWPADTATALGGDRVEAAFVGERLERHAPRAGRELLRCRSRSSSRSDPDTALESAAGKHRLCFLRRLDRHLLVPGLRRPDARPSRPDPDLADRPGGDVRRPDPAVATGRHARLRRRARARPRYRAEQSGGQHDVDAHRAAHASQPDLLDPASRRPAWRNDRRPLCGPGCRRTRLCPYDLADRGHRPAQPAGGAAVPEAARCGEGACEPALGPDVPVAFGRAPRGRRHPLAPDLAAAHRHGHLVLGRPDQRPGLHRHLSGDTARQEPGGSRLLHGRPARRQHGLADRPGLAGGSLAPRPAPARPAPARRERRGRPARLVGDGTIMGPVLLGRLHRRDVAGMERGLHGRAGAAGTAHADRRCHFRGEPLRLHRFVLRPPDLRLHRQPDGELRLALSTGRGPTGRLRRLRALAAQLALRLQRRQLTWTLSLVPLLEQFRNSPNRGTALGLCFIAFSSREPVSTSLENALGLAMVKGDYRMDIWSGRPTQLIDI
ncbi:hypothetical protein BOSE62_130095 [Bosea sp. 62]|nr:hypothetical protein BOSE7B_120095 [Bosea sp. 7B]CAD5280347.1 hypothetical protein BOSE21B_30821 [Bosea sp. 21B]CAD5281445.1 hypothetical protein BOSE46_40456 [Bosea sp. 46]VVT59439.1 hypothetical protein BOS5A_210231 [Bosea sp. EC-HK365B]VXB28951.1 hypothetical protein BOSE62_130095 [Bosea sp. 62]VXB91395.1 hypothetical protein BOSE127_160125 [Bosea sp. 127]VXC37147.1 hypothetical protein BOSE29B_30784 [Bosea sp. 29B]VXC81833.1 hypothetical protein BOSE125_50457 [Bosea sp. 125]